MAEFRGYWCERDKKTWEDTNWAERNYEELPIEEDTFEGYGYFYDMNGVSKKLMTFIKYIRPNPIYPPYYGPLYTAELKEYLKKYDFCYPMYDGHDENHVQIHDRFESNELNDMLSR